MTCIDDHYEDIRAVWLAEARVEAAEANPLRGYCQRIYFERTSCKRRSGPNTGTRSRRTRQPQDCSWIIFDSYKERE